MTEANYEESIIDIDPTPEKRPVISGGKYGANGEATLESLRPSTIKFGKFAGDPCLTSRVSIATQEYGFISIFKDWPLNGQAKNTTLKMLSNLGLDLDAMRDPSTGRVRFNPAEMGVEGMKVIAEVKLDEWDVKGPDGEPTGERASNNKVTMLWKRT